MIFNIHLWKEKCQISKWQLAPLWTSYVFSHLPVSWLTNWANELESTEIKYKLIPLCSFLYSDYGEILKQDGSQLFTKVNSDRTRENNFKSKEERFILDTREKFFCCSDFVLCGCFCCLFFGGRGEGGEVWGCFLFLFLKRVC